MLFKTFPVVGQEQNRYRAEVLFEKYGLPLYDMRECILERRLHVLMLTPYNDDTEAAAVALYEKQGNTVHLILIGTNPKFTRCGLCHRLIEQLCINPGNLLYVRTERFSMLHALFSRLGFQPSREPDETSMSHIDLTGELTRPIVLVMNPSDECGAAYASELYEAELEQDISKGDVESFLGDAAFYGFQFGALHELEGTVINEYVPVTLRNENSLESLRELAPQLVAKDTDWFRDQLAGRDYCLWLSFKLRLLYMKLANDQDFREHLWRAGLPREYDAAHFAEVVNYQMVRTMTYDITIALSCLDLLLLNTLKAETGIQFVPLVRVYGSLFKVGLGGKTRPPNLTASVFCHMQDWDAHPTFLFNLPPLIAGKALAIYEKIGEDSEYPPKPRKATRLAWK